MRQRRVNKKQLISKIPSHCSECKEGSCFLLKNCSEAVLDKISYSKKCMVFLKGQRIVIEDTITNGIYFINSGKIKIYKSDHNGKQYITRFAKEREVVGF